MFHAWEKYELNSIQRPPVSYWPSSRHRTTIQARLSGTVCWTRQSADQFWLFWAPAKDVLVVELSAHNALGILRRFVLKSTYLLTYFCADVLLGVDVCRVRIYRRQCGSVPRQSVQSVWVAHWRQLGRRRCCQQLHHIQQSLVLARSLHAAGRRHRTEVSLSATRCDFTFGTTSKALFASASLVSSEFERANCVPCSYVHRQLVPGLGLGSATAIARVPKWVTKGHKGARSPRVADRSLCLLPTDVTGRQRSAMYDGASPCSALYVSRHSLNWTGCGTGSQWRRSHNTCLMWPCFLALTLTLIHPVSNWTHWATLRRHPCLSRADTSASSQANPIFRRSLLTTSWRRRLIVLLYSAQTRGRF